MFGGVVATGNNAFASHHDDPDNLDSPEAVGADVNDSNESVGDFSPTIYTTTKSSGTKRMRQGQDFKVCKKRIGVLIRKLLSSLMTIYNKFEKGDSSTRPTFSLEESIKVLATIREGFNDDPLYFFSTSLLEDANKRMIFMAIPPEKRLKWLTYHFHNSSSTPPSSDVSAATSMDSNNRALFIKLVIATIVVIYEYYENYLCKTPRMTSTFIGDKWIGELLAGHPLRFHSMFRMSQNVFLDLLDELEHSHGLHGSSRITAREVLAMTLYILSHKKSVRAICERFQHSSNTVSRYFSLCLDSLLGLAWEVIIPIEGSFNEIPSEIANDARYFPYFKDCIGALDGTHVDARVPVSEQIAYIGRCGSPTQNILTSCDFNMCFTFFMAGWEGSAHDSRIFRFATRNTQYNFPMPPRGKYYLVDAGFPMERGFLKPFPDTKYHLPDFQSSNQLIRNRRELFNKRHSSLHGIIKRTFGVWKKKWIILRDMPTYSIKKQIKIVVATAALHNFIRRHPDSYDVDFNVLSEDQNFVPPEANEYRVGHAFEPIVEEEVMDEPDGDGVEDMKNLREEITDNLVNDMEL